MLTQSHRQVAGASVRGFVSRPVHLLRSLGLIPGAALAPDFGWILVGADASFGTGERAGSSVDPRVRPEDDGEGRLVDDGEDGATMTVRAGPR